MTIYGINDPSFYNEMISFKTPYQVKNSMKIYFSRSFHRSYSVNFIFLLQTLNMNIKYRIINGSIELANQLPLHIDVFPVRKFLSRKNMNVLYFCAFIFHRIMSA